MIYCLVSPHGLITLRALGGKGAQSSFLFLRLVSCPCAVTMNLSNEREREKISVENKDANRMKSDLVGKIKSSHNH